MNAPPQPAAAPAPVPNAELALLYLRGRDAACAHCRYPMRDAYTHVCPECGRPNTLEELVTGRSLLPTRTSWLLTAALGAMGFLVMLALALAGAALGIALVLPMVNRGEIPWLVGAVAVVATSAAWMGLLYLLARWVRLPGGLLRHPQSGPGRRRGRVLASLTTPRWVQRSIVALTISLTLVSGYSAVRMLYYTFASLQTYAPGSGYGPYYVSIAVGSLQYVLWFACALAATLCCLARLRRGDPPLRDGVVVGWLLMLLAIVPIWVLLQWVLAILL